MNSSDNDVGAPVRPTIRHEAPDPAAGTEPTGSPERKRQAGKRRKWALSALAAWTVAIASAGVVGGWALGHNASTSQPPPEKEIIEVPVVETLAESVMPDVRGMDSTDAKQALVDSGFDPGLMTLEELQWAGQPDVVIVQSPVVGEVVGDSIVLEISAPTQMPDVIGRSKSDAISALGALGVDPEVVEAFDLASRTGTVLASSPGAGRPLTDTVQLTVAQAGASVFLSTLEQVERNCSTAEARIDGTAYPNSLECSGGYDDEPSEGFWLLDRHAMLVAGTVGVDDRGESDATGAVTFVGDGKELGSYQVSYAKPQEVSLDVEGILRLEIQVLASDRSEVVLGDFLAKGTSSGIAELEVN